MSPGMRKGDDDWGAITGSASISVPKGITRVVFPVRAVPALSRSAIDKGRMYFVAQAESGSYSILWKIRRQGEGVVGCYPRLTDSVYLDLAAPLVLGDQQSYAETQG